ncbi:hypothetical protein DMUE_5488 [Dictyocoela muelleri]|nr:hypothetical protein DMUE_5488 [Dictyocoela muelleri]
MSSFKNLEEAINEEMRDKVNNSNENLIVYATYDYVSELTGLKIQHKIEILKNRNSQDIMKWSLIFKEISAMCDFSEEIKFEALELIISLDIRSRIVYKRSL